MVPNNVSAHTSMALCILPGTFTYVASRNHLVRQVLLLSLSGWPGKKQTQKLSDSPKVKELKSGKHLMVDTYDERSQKHIPNWQCFRLVFFLHPLIWSLKVMVSLEGWVTFGVANLIFIAVFFFFFI